MSESADVLVIGGGAAGLAAARELARAGISITLVEARDRLGGRICTDHSPGFPVELGAEFVHGRSPDIFEPIREAGLDLVDVAGEMRQKRKRLWDDSGDVMAEVNHLFENMPSAGSDQPFKQYIDHSRYSGQTKELALNFVEGFHAADPARVSVHWLIRTTEAEESIDGESSHRFKHGYFGLIDFMAKDIHARHCRIFLNTPVSDIHWRPGEVTARAGAQMFHAARAIITLPLGVLQSGSISFDPPLPPGKGQAMRCLEMGPVIHVVLAFRDRFWEELPEMRNLSFLFTDDPQFPTWWTANPLPYPVLTGWAAGRYARSLAGRSKDELLSAAVKSLARIVETDEPTLRLHLQHGLVHDWQADPFSCGAYSYVLSGGMGAPRALAAPVAGTLFFAGEATNTEGHNGTVHGAIGSGKRAAQEVMEIRAK